MSERNEAIELLAPLVGNEEAVRLWTVIREPGGSDGGVSLKTEFASALRAWLVVRGHETSRKAAFAIVEDAVNLISALEHLTGERYSWLAMSMRGALGEMREQRPPG